jgi:hypothetical protein
VLDIDQALSRALIGVAAALQLELLDAEDPARVFEADLRSAVRRHLNRQLDTGFIAQAEVSIGKSIFRAAGATDESGDSYPAAIELKCRADASNRIDDALWDAVKMATFVREGVAGYLIAAGAATTWVGKNPLLRFWEGGEWLLAEIQQLKPYYQKVFGESKGPSVLPAGLRSAPIGVPVAIHTIREVWSVRSCRIWPR